MMFKKMKVGFVAVVLSVLGFFAAATDATAQTRRLPVDIGDVTGYGGKLVKIKVGEITLESINFRDQTAQLSIGLDVANSLVPVSLKDFDYSLRLFGQQAIEGRYDGTLKLGGRRGSRVNLPVVVHLRSIPSMVWSAFSNRGQVQYELDTGFTLPLFVTERRFDQSFSGEVPLRSLVDAATILRARGLGGTRVLGW